MNDNQNEILAQYETILADLRAENMTAFRTNFLELLSYEQGQVYLALPIEQRQQVYRYLSPKEMAEMFDVIEEEADDIPDLISEMKPTYVSAMLAEMYTDNAADLLAQLGKNDAIKFLSLMDKDIANELRNLLNYEDKTAGAIMGTDYVAIVANQTVRSAMHVIKQEAANAETIYYAYVTDLDNRLLGVISLRELLVSDDDVMIADVMNERVIAVKVAEDQEDVARMVRDYDFLAVPVVDYDERLIGIIMVDDIIDVIDDEAASDYSGLAGVDVDEVSENPIKAASKRLPWLITLLFLGMSTASLISHYEELVSEASILAVFISLITGTAGNAGTQSLAVAVRRLALADDGKRSFMKLIASEILTGLVTGVVTGITICLVVGIWRHNFTLGFVIGMAMLCAITVANLAGSLIPMLMDKLGFDPAVASGPFITTLSDLTSVLIYFNIASMFMSYFINH